MYRFTKCPPNLVSSFHDGEAETSDESNAEVAKTDEQSTAKAHTKDSENTQAKVTARAETNARSNELPKVINKTDKNNIPNKPTNEHKVVSKTVKENKPLRETKTASENTPVKVVTEAKANVEQKTNANKVVNKQADKVHTAVDRTSTENKNAKPFPSKAPVTKEVNTPIKPGTPESKTTEKGNKSQVYNDYDELDDNDILALMSEGIVVDEWSETDD